MHKLDSYTSSHISGKIGSESEALCSAAAAPKDTRLEAGDHVVVIVVPAYNNTDASYIFNVFQPVSFLAHGACSVVVKLL